MSVLLLIALAASADDLGNTVGVTVAATSSAPNAEPEKLINRASDRGWCEGAKGAGIRETVTLQLSRPVPLRDVVLEVLAAADHDVPSALVIEVPDQPPVRLEAFGGRMDREVKAGFSGAPVDKVTVRIAGVDKAARGETCLSELRLVTASGPLVLWPGLTEDDRVQVAALMHDARAALASCEVPALAKVISAKLKVEDIARRCKAGELTLPAPDEAALREAGGWRLDLGGR